MGRVITGRGDVFNYKRGEMSRGMETVKPYDYGKLMTNIHRGAIITEKAMKSELGAAGSPLITAPKAAYGALKAGGKWAGEQLGLRDPDPLSEAARVKAMAQGKVLPKPPVAAPVPGPQGGFMVRPDITERDPNITARESGRPSVKRIDPDVMRPEELPDHIAELFKLQAQAVTPDLAASYQPDIDRLQAEYRNALNQRTQPQPPAVPVPPQAPPIATPQVATGAPAPTPGGFAAIGPETAALAGGMDQQRDIALALQQEAHRQLSVARDRGTAEERAQAMGLKGMDLLRNRPFNAGVRELAANIGSDPQVLVDVFWAESDMDPASKHDTESSSGLIQIIESRAAEIGTTSAALRAMNPIDQLPYIQKYFELVKRQNPGIDYSLPGHVDAAVFGPARAAGPRDAVMYSEGTRDYAKNKDVDLNGDGKITVQERLDWSALAAKKKGGPIPTLAPPRDLPPAPTREDLTAQDLVGQRQQVDVGAVVVPGVRPQSVNYGNLLVMARNADGDAQKNWVRQLVLEDDTKLPWSNLGDLFTGAYKTRAAKAVEDAFAKEMDPLKKAKIGYYDASAERAKRPAVARAKARSRSHGKKTPKVWVRVLDDLKSKRTRLLDQADDLRKAMRAVTTQSISAFEGTSPIQKSAESTEDFVKRTEIWQNKVTAIETSRTVGRGNKIADLQSQLDKVDNALRRVDRTYQNGIDLSTSSPDAIPRAWNERRHSMLNELDFGPAPQEWGGGRAPAKASAKPPAKTPTTTTKPGSTGNSGLHGHPAPP